MPEQVLIFHIGRVGDTLVTLPALQAIRQAVGAGARITMLHEATASGWAAQPQLLRGTGLVDEFEPYVPGRLRQLLAVGWRLRKRRFRRVFYLAPTERPRSAIRRDRWFFRLVMGIGQMVGARMPDLPDRTRPLKRSADVGELFLQRLQRDGIDAPPAGSVSLRLSGAERQPVVQWLNERVPAGRVPIAVAPCSNMPAKNWPLDRFVEVVRRLVKSHNVWPVVIGGPGEEKPGDVAIAGWQCGSNSAGAHSLREMAALLEQCRLYLGNDTGPMHMAALMGCPCVAVFSARDLPGLWDPRGQGHRVLRTDGLPCEGCMLTECVEQQKRCIMEIGVDAVHAACEDVLREGGVAADPAHGDGCGAN